MSSSAADESSQVTRTGKVVRHPFGVGSRSEHEAVSLESDSGVYKLRRMGGHAFTDPVLEELVGKRLRATGLLFGSSLIMLAWDELADDDADSSPG